MNEIKKSLGFQEKAAATEVLRNIPQIYHPSVRMIDLNLMAHSLWCVECDMPLTLRNCVSDDSTAHKTLLQVRCLNCSKIFPITLSLLDKNGDCAAYCAGLITTSTSDLNYRKLADRCIEVSKQLDMLNSNEIPRPKNPGNVRPLPVAIPDNKVMDTFRKLSNKFLHQTY